MRADALAGLGLVGARVAHDLQQRRRFAEVLVEIRLGCAERERPGPQQLAGNTREVLLPLRGDLAQLGLGVGPQVRPDEAREVGRLGVGDDIALGTDVDLLAPVDLALRALAADARVSAELRTVQILDRELVGLIELEELARRAVQARLELGRHARSGQVEEPDVVRRGAQVVSKARGGLGALIELRQVEDRQGEVGHRATIGGCRGIRPLCFVGLPCHLVTVAAVGAASRWGRSGGLLGRRGSGRRTATAGGVRRGGGTRAARASWRARGR